MDFEGVRPRRARAALRHVTGLSTGPAVDPDLRITLDLHPDRLCGGLPVLRSLARDRAYHSQFVTGTSNGGLTAHPGGDRRRWESRIFGGAYDDAPATERPVYGALDFRRQVVGAAPRFGSSHFRLTAAALTRATFCYPDSAAEPADFGTAAAMALVAVAGPMSGTPSTTTSKPRSTAASTSPGTSRRWHADLGARIAEDGRLDPRIIGVAARTGRYVAQDLKMVWHTLARHGAPEGAGAACVPRTSAGRAS